MALNKYMHPRNIYKKPPDFAKLAKQSVEFGSVAKVDVSGKVTIDFKDPNSLRILTKSLLKSDFNLDVDIPEDRLVPTLPLRLNYILWIEDLVNSVQRTENVRGLDIGTGACAIYPLLAASKNKWHMVGTETDEKSLQKAMENVQTNNLQDLIELKKNPSATILDFLFSSGSVENFDFCMCNPPFYSSIQELCESRSPARIPPKNGFTGSPQELITDGGELAFCRKILKESKDFKDKVQIFTTMVGHKYNVRELVQDLQMEGINYTTTEFCQGRVTRWGLAWTYQDLDLALLGRDKLRKKTKPIAFLLPEIPGIPYNFQSISEKIKYILQDLKITYKILNKKGANLVLDIKAAENTWSNQRRKRRLKKKVQENVIKKPKLCETDIIDPAVSKKSNDTMKPHCGKTENVDNKPKPMFTTSEREISTQEKPITDEIVENEYKNDHNESLIEGHEYDYSDHNASLECNHLVHAFLRVFKNDNVIILEIEFLDGTAGKEGVHQIIQYVKNNWK